MRKLILGFSGLLLLVLVCTFAQGSSKATPSNSATGDYVIIRYVPFDIQRPYVLIHSGGEKVQEIMLTKEEVNKTVSNYVIDLLTKFNSEGYELISTTSAGANGQINCFLKRVK